MGMKYFQTPFQTITKGLQKTSKHLLVFTNLYLCLQVPAQAFDSTEEEALRQTQKALLQTKYARIAKSKAETYIKRTIQPPKGSMAALAAGAMAITQQKISTARFKNLRLRGETWKIEPDVEYDLGNGNVAGTLNFDLSF